MKPFLLYIFFIAIGLHPVFAQKIKDETVIVPQNKGIELGLNVTSTLAGFFNSGGDRAGTDPYLLSVKIANPTGAIRLGLHGASKKENTTQCSNNFCGNRILTDATANLRVGYEWRNTMSKQFVFFWGIDGIAKWVTSETITNFPNANAVIANKKTGFGGGGVAGVQFWLNKRIALATETSLYAIYLAGNNELFLPPAAAQKTPISSFEIVPMLPNSLFFTFRF
jgi:hypothetical protein